MFETDDEFDSLAKKYGVPMPKAQPISADPKVRAVINAANKLGIDPLDYATTISYETAGTFDPWQKGPVTKWGQHRGTIQYGEPQAKQYGVYQGQSFEDQVENSNVRYLRDRGVKPGDGLDRIYKAINGGSVKASGNASDGYGTINSHIAKMRGEHRAKAAKFLGISYDGGGAQTAPETNFDSLDKKYGNPAPETNFDSLAAKYGIPTSPTPPVNAPMPTPGTTPGQPTDMGNVLNGAGMLPEAAPLPMLPAGTTPEQLAAQQALNATDGRPKNGKGKIRPVLAPPPVTNPTFPVNSAVLPPVPTGQLTPDTNLPVGQSAPLDPVLPPTPPTTPVGAKVSLTNGKVLTKTEDQAGVAKYKDELGFDYMGDEKGFRRVRTETPQLELMGKDGKQPEYVQHDDQEGVDASKNQTRLISLKDGKDYIATRKLTKEMKSSYSIVPEHAAPAPAQSRKTANGKIAPQIKRTAPQAVETKAQYSFERTKQLKREDGSVLTYLPEDRAGLKDNEFRMVDAGGNRFKFDPTQDPETALTPEDQTAATPEADVFDKVPIQLEERSFYNTPELAGKVYAGNVADQIADKIQVPKEDIVDYYTQNGFTDLVSGEKLPEERLFAQKPITGGLGETITTDFIKVTNKTVERIKAFSQNKAALKSEFEAAKADFIKAGNNEDLSELLAKQKVGLGNPEELSGEIEAYTTRRNELAAGYRETYRARFGQTELTEAQEAEIEERAGEEARMNIKRDTNAYGSLVKMRQVRDEWGALPTSEKLKAHAATFGRVLPSLIASTLKSVGAMENIVPKLLGLESNAVDIFGKQKMRAADKTELYKLGEAYEWARDELMPANPLAQESYVTPMVDGAGQALVQGAIAWASGGTAIPGLIGLGQGFAAQHDEARKRGAPERERLVLGVVGGMVAMPDLILMKGWFKNLTTPAKQSVFKQAAVGVYRELRGKVSEAEAKSIVRSGFAAMLTKAETLGMKLGIGAAEAPQIVERLTIGSGARILATSIPGEMVQEVSENKGNKLAEKYFNPAVKWSDIITFNKEDLMSAIGGAAGGGAGATIQIVTQHLNERKFSEAQSALSFAHKNGDITPQQFENMQTALIRVHADTVKADGANPPSAINPVTAEVSRDTKDILDLKPRVGSTVEAAVRARSGKTEIKTGTVEKVTENEGKDDSLIVNFDDGTTQSVPAKKAVVQGMAGFITPQAAEQETSLPENAIDTSATNQAENVKETAENLIIKQGEQVFVKNADGSITQAKFIGFENDKANVIIDKQKVTVNRTDVSIDTPTTPTVAEAPQSGDFPKSAVTSSGTRVNYRGKVIDESDILTSFDEGFPKDELQPRNTDRKASREKIINNAANLDTSLMDDAPTAGDGAPKVYAVQVNGQTKYIAVTRNHGVESIREANRTYPEKAQEYQNFARSKDPATTAANPVYVHEIEQGSIPDLAKFAVDANVGSQRKMSDVEQADTDAKILTPAVMNKFVPAEDGSIHSGANRDFIRGFLETVVDKNEHGAMQTETGELSQTGVRRIKNAIFARAFGGTKAGMSALARMAESTNDNVKNVTNALLAKSGAFADLRQAISDGKRFRDLDITPDIAAAAQKFSEIKADSAQSVDLYLKQDALFGKETTPFQDRILQVLDKYGKNGKAIRTIFENYLDSVNAIGDPNQKDLYGNTAAFKTTDVFQAAVELYEENNNARQSTKQDQSGLFTDTQPQTGGANQTTDQGISETEIGEQTATENSPKVNYLDKSVPLPDTFTFDGITVSVEPMTKGLDDRLKGIQDSTIRQVLNDPQKWIDLYYKNHGNIEINSDEAKKQFEEYDIDPLANVAGVHEASAIVASLILGIRLRELPPNSSVLATAGGGGSGKGYVLKAIDPATKKPFIDKSKYGLIYDSVMKSAKGNDRVIQQIIDAGHAPEIVAVFTPIEIAAIQNLRRSTKEDVRRLVPLTVLPGGHHGFQQTFLEQTAHYIEDFGVTPQFFFNDGANLPTEITFEQFKEKVYTDIEVVKEKAAEASYEELRTNPRQLKYDERAKDALEGKPIPQVDTRTDRKVEAEQRGSVKSGDTGTPPGQSGDIRGGLPGQEQEVAGSLDYGTVDAPNRANLAQGFARHFASGDGFAGIVPARKFAGNLLGGKVESGTQLSKIVDEAIEVGIVLTARTIISDFRKDGRSDADIYTRLVDLYENSQPNLSVRTSTSMLDQAYSTPAPLAFIASRLAGITENSGVYEPTAGNGMLLIEANPDSTVANELNKDRLANLKQILPGANIQNHDAANWKPQPQFDVVIENPPFGVVRDENETTITFQINDKYSTNEIDHAIAFKSLEAMKDGGRAVLIVGGVQGGEDTRSDKYNAGAKRKFYFSLYNQYNVTDHFTIDGGMYAKQGAGYPVDVIVINGRGQSDLDLPAASVPRTYKSYADLGKILDEKRTSQNVLDTGISPDVSTGGQTGVSTDNGSQSKSESADGQGTVPGVSDGQSAGTDSGGARQGKRGNRNTSRSSRKRIGRNAIGRESLGKFDTEQLPPPGTSQPDRTESAENADNGKRPGSGTDLQRDDIDGLDDGASGVSPFGNGVTTNDADALLDSIFDEADAADNPPTPIPAPRPRPAGTRTKTTKTQTTPTKTTTAPTVGDYVGDINALLGIEPSLKRVEEQQTTHTDENGFNPGVYEKLKTPFIGVYQAIKNEIDSFESFGRAFVTKLRTDFGYTVENLRKLKPYLSRFLTDVANGVVTLETSNQTKTTTPTTTETEKAEPTASQVPYIPASGSYSLETLVPANMQTAVGDALGDLQAAIGDVDAYVREKLNYAADEEMPLSAEARDAIALAVYNIEKGAGFIIGDQTGIGKGRMVAGVIRYALQNNLTPIFVTEKPNLYADMIRDLTDIGVGKLDENGLSGVNPLMTNSKESVQLDGEGKHFLKHKRGSVEQAVREGNLGEFDIIFTTYSQMQTPNGKRSARHDLIDYFGDGGIVILDESHNAGGGADAQKVNAQGLNTSRAAYVRNLIRSAKGVFYSSGTFAKRPEVMDLYFKTDIAKAVSNLNQLPDIINAGGVPLQQVVSAMLARAGQYLRRERSFAGVEYNTKVALVDKNLAENVSATMASIDRFSRIVRKETKTLDKKLKKEAKSMSFNRSAGDAGARSTNFTSLMHNLVGQMLLGLKVPIAADEAIATLKRGEKPVLTLASTMGSFIEEYVESYELNSGDAISLNFGTLLERYLERSRYVTVTGTFGDKEKIRLEDEDIGAEGVAAYNEVMSIVQKTDWSSIPASPIDYLKNRIAEAGYTTGEITGRMHTIDYSGEIPVYRLRPAKEIGAQGRSKTINGFNNGDIGAIVLNQAGSTGLSLHASDRVKNQDKRHMIIVQAELNIDTHMQMLGRVHRTGQVQVPHYTQLVADVPAEKRPASVLSKKMASLNANTTANRDSHLTAKDTPDFINRYGDKVAFAMMEDNPDLHKLLGFPLGENISDDTDAMTKVTGRIPLLPLAQQEDVYDQLESEYLDYMAQLDAMGENGLVAKTYDLGAKTLQTTTIFEGAPGSIFTEDARAEFVDMKRQGKPFSTKVVAEQIGKTLEREIPESEIDNFGWVSEGQDYTRKIIAEARERFSDYRRSILDEIDEDNPAKMTQVSAQLQSVEDRFKDILGSLAIGAPVTLRIGIEDKVGVVTKIEQKGKTKNPLALGSWRVTFATADATRQLIIPVSKLYSQDTNAELKVASANEGMVLVSRLYGNTTGMDRTPIMRLFDQNRIEAREKRFIVTGNVLAGFGIVKGGQIISFTDDAGRMRQGILMPRAFNLTKTLDDAPVLFNNPEQVLDFLSTGTGTKLVTNEEKTIRISVNRDGSFQFATPAAKAAAGFVFLNKQLIGLADRDFIKVGQSMVATPLTRETALSMMRFAETQFEAKFQTDVYKDAAREITGEQKPQATNVPDPSLKRGDVGSFEYQLTETDYGTLGNLRAASAHLARINPTTFSSLEGRGLVEQYKQNGMPFVRLTNEGQKLSKRLNLNGQRLKRTPGQTADFHNAKLAAPADIMANATIERSGSQVKLNLEGQEFIRRILEEADIRAGRRKLGDETPEASFTGLFADRQNTAKVIKTLRAIEKEAAKAGNAEVANFAKKYADTFDNAAREGQGTAVAYMFDEALPHEVFHQNSFLASFGKSLMARHAYFEKLAATPAFTGVTNYLLQFAEYRAMNLANPQMFAAVAVEEAGAYIEGGEYDILGISLDDAADYMNLFYDSFVEANAERDASGKITLKAAQKALGIFEGENKNAEIQRIYAAYAESADGQANQESVVDEPGEVPAGAQTGDESADSENIPKFARQRGQKLRSLPATLREAGFDAENLLYSTLSDNEAKSNAGELLATLGIEGAIDLIDTTVAPDATHAQLGFMVSQVLQAHANAIEATNPSEAAETRLVQAQFSADLATRFTKAGQFISAARVVQNSVGALVASAVSVANTKGKGGLTVDETLEFQRLGEQNETTMAKLVDLQRKLDDTQAQLSRAKEEKAGKTPTPTKAGAKARVDLVTAIRKEFVPDADALIAEIQAELLNPALKQIEGGLLAPNGKPSNLTPFRHAQVGTPSTDLASLESSPDGLPIAKEEVDGREVTADIPNQDSISASLDNYEIMKDVREVPMSLFGDQFESNAKTKKLASGIKENGWIDPLIVVFAPHEDSNYYILEGATRFDALGLLNAKSFPALIVKDLDSIAKSATGNNGEYSEDDSILKHIATPSKMQQPLFDKMTKVGAVLLTQGLAKKTGVYTPDNFRAEMRGLFGNAVDEEIGDLHAAALNIRKKWMADIAFKSRKTDFQKMASDAAGKAKLEAEIGEAISDPITDEDVYRILNVRKDVARKRRAAEKMHSFVSGFTRRQFTEGELQDLGNVANLDPTPLFTTSETDSTIAELAENENEAAGAKMLTDGATKAEFLVRFRALGFSVKDAVKIYIKSAKLLKDVRKAVSDNHESYLEDAALNTQLVNDIKDEITRQRAAASRQSREITAALEKLEQSKAKRVVAGAVDLSNATRSLMAAVDLSAGMRQGGYFSLSNPEQQAAAYADMIKSFTEKGYGRVVQDIEAHPRFLQSQRMGLEMAIAGTTTDITKEEVFKGTEMLENFKFLGIPFGKAIKFGITGWSERTYSAFLDQQRMTMYNLFAGQLEETMIDGEYLNAKDNPDQFKFIAQFINIATGKGVAPKNRLGKMLLDMPFFAPRYALSRFQLLNKTLNPVAYYNMPAGTRRVVAKSAVRFYGTVGVITGIMAALGASFTWDDDDEDFLKFKFGNASFDLFAGTLQPAKLIIKAVHSGIRTKGGQDERVPYEFTNDLTKAGMRFLRGKLSPSLSYAVDALVGSDYLGNPFSWGWGALQRVTPLTIAEFVKAGQEEGLIGIGKTIPAIAGVGVQRYERRPEKAQTAAEKLALKMAGSNAPDKRKTTAEIEGKKLADRLTFHARTGIDVREDVRLAVKGGQITETQAKDILGAKGKGFFQDKVERLPQAQLEKLKEYANEEENRVLDKLLGTRREKVEKKEQNLENKQTRSDIVTRALAGENVSENLKSLDPKEKKAVNQAIAQSKNLGLTSDAALQIKEANKPEKAIEIFNGASAEEKKGLVNLLVVKQFNSKTPAAKAKYEAAVQAYRTNQK